MNANQYRSLYFFVIGRNRVSGGHGEGIGESVLPWKNIFDNVPNTIQRKLGTRIYQFLWICLGLRTGGIDLVQDICIADSKTDTPKCGNDIRFLGKQTEITEVRGTTLGRA